MNWKCFFLSFLVVIGMLVMPIVPQFLSSLYSCYVLGALTGFWHLICLILGIALDIFLEVILIQLEYWVVKLLDDINTTSDFSFDDHKGTFVAVAIIIYIAIDLFVPSFKNFINGNALINYWNCTGFKDVFIDTFYAGVVLITQLYLIKGMLYLFMGLIDIVLILFPFLILYFYNRHFFKE